MESYISKDGTVAKYVHDDGSETTIKTLNPGDAGCGGSGRDKFNVFASCGVGCNIKCTFCYLTVKRYVTAKLNCNAIVENISDAIDSEITRRPGLRTKPMNISWMGMGDPWNDLSNIESATSDILLNYAGDADIPVEGVDIATTLPNINYSDELLLNSMNSELLRYRLTIKPTNRSNVRIFYSLHSLDNSVRKKLIPRTIDLQVALPYLESLNKYNVIYHYMFLDGVNDQKDDIDRLIRYFSKDTRQLRILRYNKCTGAKFKESEKFNDIIGMLSVEIPNIKVQLSPGSEIMAACGMFVMKSVPFN